MNFSKIPLQDAWMIELDPVGDERGQFARTFCRREFEAHGISIDVVQSNCSRSRSAGTLRGLHFQRPPMQETKLVRCTSGRVYDVMVDLRSGSATRFQYFGAELSPENGLMLLVPKGFAHGFITLEDDSELIYLVDQYYSPEHEAGLRFNDPAIGIPWPREAAVVSLKDRQWPLLSARSDNPAPAGNT
jgi:dTDP-4-dehydrorhamnose 3,5-epimerase